MNFWSSEWNAFSMFVVTKHPPILLRYQISTISDINLPPSPINLFLIYAVYYVEVKLERAFLKELLKPCPWMLILVSEIEIVTGNLLADKATKIPHELLLLVGYLK